MAETGCTNEDLLGRPQITKMALRAKIACNLHGPFTLPSRILHVTEGIHFQNNLEEQLRWTHVVCLIISYTNNARCLSLAVNEASRYSSRILHGLRSNHRSHKASRNSSRILHGMRQFNNYGISLHVTLPVSFTDCSKSTLVTLWATRVTSIIKSRSQ